MRANGLRHEARRCVVAALFFTSLGALAGCGAETPPYDELALRDALNAAPEVLASLSEQSRREIALRLEAAQANGGDETSVANAGVATVPALVRSADAVREEEDKDAIVLGALDLTSPGPASPGFVLRALAATDPAEGAPAQPALTGEPAGSTAALESAALRGRAGAIVAGLAKRSAAHEIVRITGVPAGVITMGQTVYVNASWLVALSALDPVIAAAPAPAAPAGKAALEAPPLSPQSVRANPYRLPASIAECAAGVRDVCTCAAAAQCDHEPTDPGFLSGQLECEWVSADPARAEALCVLALMSIEGVKECVQSAGAACSKVPITNRDDALAFAADAGCLGVLDHCLQYGEPPSSSSGSCSSCDSSEESSEPSTTSSGCGKTCSDCNQNCSDCNQNCSDCNDNSKDCNDNCKNSAAYDGSAATCRLSADRRPRSSGRASLGTVFWLLAPAGYVARRARRRS